MVKNREELLRVALENATQMKEHLRMGVTGFIEAQNTNVEELSYALGVDPAEIYEIIEGQGNISLDTLSKLLVATDCVVEIKPVGMSPMGRYGEGMPRSGGYPVDHMGRPIPPPPGFVPRGFTPPPFGQGVVPPPMGRATAQPQAEAPTQARDSRGRFVRRTPSRAAAPRQAQAQSPFLAMPAEELIGIIRQNLWDGEIDTATATQEELARFVMNKEALLRRRTKPEGAAQASRQPIPHRRPLNIPEGQGATEATTQKEPSNANSSSLENFMAMLQNMAEEARNNPQLAETISRFMPK